MDSFFQYLAANPTFAAILFSVIIVIIFILLGIVIDAYRKGQPLSLWLIKIEAKAAASSTNKLKKPEQSDVSIEQVSLANRENFPQAFRVRLAKAKEVCMLGINVNGIVANYGSFIIEKAKDGCKFRFLLVDPRFFEREEMTTALWQEVCVHK